MKSLLPVLFFFLSVSAFSQTGIGWTPAIDVAANTWDNMHPRIMLDGNEDPLIIWGDLPGQCNFSRWNGSAFSTPVTLNPSIPAYVYTWAGPDMASRGDTVYVVFKHNASDSAYIYLLRSFDGGITFSLPFRVDNIADSLSDFPAVGIDQFGHPLVAFMRYETGYLNVRWVVARSTDYGSTFLPDVLASSASGPEVCDCCPASIVSSSSNVALLYRANISNIRDNWIALSTDGGASFPNGMNIDQHNWSLSSCPSSGPDGVIVDDTLYSVFMNGAGGYRVYSNRNELNASASGPSASVTGTITGLTQQNYPRIASRGTAVAELWKQVISGTTHLSLLYTDNIHNGFAPAFDTITSGSGGNMSNADVAVSSNAVHVVWQNDLTGTVKYRKGIIGAAGIAHPEEKKDLTLFPNPAGDELRILHGFGPDATFTICGLAGNVLLAGPLADSQALSLKDLADGSYFFTVLEDGKAYSKKLIVIH